MAKKINLSLIRYDTIGLRFDYLENEPQSASKRGHNSILMREEFFCRFSEINLLSERLLLEQKYTIVSKSR